MGKKKQNEPRASSKFLDEGPSLLARHHGALSDLPRASLHKHFEASSSRTPIKVPSVSACATNTAPRFAPSHKPLPRNVTCIRALTTFLELSQSATWDPSILNRQEAPQRQKPRICSEEGVARSFPFISRIHRARLPRLPTLNVDPRSSSTSTTLAHPAWRTSLSRSPVSSCARTPVQHRRVEAMPTATLLRKPALATTSTMAAWVFAYLPSSSS